MQAKAILELCLNWFDRYREVVNAGLTQNGDTSHYRLRRLADSQLEPELSLAE